MKALSQSLYELLQTPVFSEAQNDACAQAVRQWRIQHNIDDQLLPQVLTHLAAQLLHAVRCGQFRAAHAAETLNRLLVLSDLDIPPSLYALREAMSLLSQRPRAGQTARDGNDEQFVRHTMGRILPTLPVSQAHVVDAIRYHGRFGLLQARAG